MKEGYVECIFCQASVRVDEWDGHICDGTEQYYGPSRTPSPTLSEVLDSIQPSSHTPASSVHLSDSDCDEEEPSLLPMMHRSIDHSCVSPVTQLPMNGSPEVSPAASPAASPLLFLPASSTPTVSLTPVTTQNETIDLTASGVELAGFEDSGQPLQGYEQVI